MSQRVTPQPPRAPVIVVDELAERNVSVGYTTVVFRPGEVITSPALLKIARENNVYLKERR